MNRYRKQFVVDEEAVTLEILDTAGQGQSMLSHLTWDLTRHLRISDTGS